MELYKARIEEQKNYLNELNHQIELKENELGIIREKELMEEIKLLKKEIEKLKKENEKIKKENKE